MKSTLLLLFILVGSCSQSFGQKKSKHQLLTPTNKQLTDNSTTLVSPIKSIGPTVMSGRVVDVEVDPSNPHHFFAAFATGGLWVTSNNGQSFSPLFQNEEVSTIGDIAVHWASNSTIWIGTGENNSSRSSYAGNGIYKSSDNGTTWEHSGLSDSHHIGRIVLHPTDPQKIWVAALGHLYSPNEERGVFYSADGGASWTRQLFVNSTTGAIDLIINPINPNELFAAMWDKERAAWNFRGHGKNSGVYHSTNGGATWTKITSPESLFPQGDGIGRIGLDIAATQEETKLFVILDNQNTREAKKDTTTVKPLTAKDFEKISVDSFLALEEKKVTDFLEKNGFPDKYSYAFITKEIKENRLLPSALFDYVFDANEELFETPIIGAEVYTWTSKKPQWTRSHSDYLDDLFYSYGYYFSQIRVNPNDHSKLYLLGVPLIKSNDAGKTWVAINPDNVHVDHHALWINPNNPKHLINGSDGGIHISYDDGENFTNCNSLAVAQAYAVQIDHAKPYNVYAGFQDNGVWYGPSTYTFSPAWKNNGHYSYREITGGDGMQIQIDPRDESIVYTGYQFGHYTRFHLKTGEQKYIHPTHELGEKPLRWNWQTPILLSKHQPDIFYICSNKVHRSLDQGNNFTTLSGDLTRGSKKGNVPFGTITCIDESRFQFGLLAVGSDDGLVHVSHDNGYTWKNSSPPAFGSLWVSDVHFSNHDKNTLYVTGNNYRNDDFKAYLYVSKDLGATWQLANSSLPQESINVVKEDHRYPHILYIGTDKGLYISYDQGNSWALFSEQLPRVAVHDLAIQTNESDLVIGTHGRGIWIADTEYIAYTHPDSLLAKSLVMFAPDSLAYNENWGQTWSKWLDTEGPTFELNVMTASAQTLVFTLSNEKNEILSSLTFPAEKCKRGWNKLTIPLEINSELAIQNEEQNNKEKEDKKHYPKPGNYTLGLSNGDTSVTQQWVIYIP
jgi:photosystem II stability/assembly factor-like uncharacterized protein